MRERAAIELEIDEVSELRVAAQRAGVRGKAEEFAARLDELYGELRERKAFDLYGSRESIAQQARVERELEKISRTTTTTA